ncbi:MAG: metallophosphoesterase family protein [Opitutaceae bacterium]|nr:metallophosphoesterase family protein [Opitutaceae bacterium]
MPEIRILSDLHFGDRASQVTSLQQLRPLLEGVGHVVLNGDTLDTRPGPHPAHTAEARAMVSDFFPRHTPEASFITGNHDPDFGVTHETELAGGDIWITHGDVFFEEIVPWGNDAPLMRARLEAELAGLAPEHRADLRSLFAAVRRVAFSIPQRHQSERNPWKHAWRYLGDSVWPPTRAARILRAWRDGPRLAASFASLHRPRARFLVCGHTHRPGAFRQPDGRLVLNTGSFCRPLGGLAIDLEGGRLLVRPIVRRRGEFRAGASLADFALAAG